MNAGEAVANCLPLFKMVEYKTHDMSKLSRIAQQIHIGTWAGFVSNFVAPYPLFENPIKETEWGTYLFMDTPLKQGLLERLGEKTYLPQILTLEDLYQRELSAGQINIEYKLKNSLKLNKHDIARLMRATIDY